MVEPGRKAVLTGGSHRASAIGRAPFYSLNIGQQFQSAALPLL
jgi:hypothetical protein